MSRAPSNRSDSGGVPPAPINSRRRESHPALGIRDGSCRPAASPRGASLVGESGSILSARSNSRFTWLRLVAASVRRAAPDVVGLPSALPWLRPGLAQRGPWLPSRRQALPVARPRGSVRRLSRGCRRLDAAVFGAFLARHPSDCGDQQDQRYNNDDDPNDSAGSHVGSSDWLSILIVEIGSN